MDRIKHKLIRMEAPCKGCVEPKRHMGCHGTCQEYVEWRKERDDLLKQKAINVQINDAYMDVRHANLNKAIKHRHKKK